MIASRPYLNPYLRISEGRLTSREVAWASRDTHSMVKLRNTGEMM